MQKSKSDTNKIHSGAPCSFFKQLKSWLWFFLVLQNKPWTWKYTYNEVRRGLVNEFWSTQSILVFLENCTQNQHLPHYLQNRIKIYDHRCNWRKLWSRNLLSFQASICVLKSSWQLQRELIMSAGNEGIFMTTIQPKNAKGREDHLGSLHWVENHDNNDTMGECICTNIQLALMTYK